VLKPFHYWLILVLAAMSILLVALNAGLYFSNRSLQANVEARARYIQEAQSLRSLYEELAKALANLAVEQQDDQLRALLAGEGLTINQTPTEPAEATEPIAR
jgi:ABC-type transport system involved in cytochrome bd biosynthesis fused ATPase/permease subunit